MSLKDKIIELRNKKMTYNQIAKELGCSKSVISYHCKSIDNQEIININVNIKNKRQIKEKSFLLENIDIDKVIDLRRDKNSYEEIKNITGYSIDSISKVCKEYDLVESRRFSKIDDELINKINESYKIHISTRKVSKELNVSRDSVSKYLTDENRELSKLNRGRKISKSKAVVDWRKRTKIKLVEYKGGCCIICGYNKCLNVLQFHHLNPDEKDFTIGGKSWSFERLKKEVDKCILVCSNCHIEIHEEDRKLKMD